MRCLFTTLTKKFFVLFMTRFMVLIVLTRRLKYHKFKNLIFQSPTLHQQFLYLKTEINISNLSQFLKESHLVKQFDDIITIPEKYVFTSDDLNIKDDNHFYVILNKLQYWMISDHPKEFIRYWHDKLEEFRNCLFDELVLINKKYPNIPGLDDDAVLQSKLVVSIINRMKNKDVLIQLEKRKLLNIHYKKNILTSIYENDLADCIEYLSKELGYFKVHKKQAGNLSIKYSRYTRYHSDLCHYAFINGAIKVLKYLHEEELCYLHVDLKLEKTYIDDLNKPENKDKKNKIIDALKYIIVHINQVDKNITAYRAVYYYNLFSNHIISFCALMENIELLELAFENGFEAQQYQFNDYQIYYYSQSEDTIINCILSNKKKMLDYLIKNKHIDIDQTYRSIFYLGSYDMYEWLMKNYPIQINTHSEWINILFNVLNIVDLNNDFCYLNQQNKIKIYQDFYSSHVPLNLIQYYNNGLFEIFKYAYEFHEISEVELEKKKVSQRLDIYELTMTHNNKKRKFQFSLELYQNQLLLDEKTKIIRFLEDKIKFQVD